MHTENKVHNDVLKKISSKVFESKFKEHFTEEASPTEIPTIKGLKKLEVPHADSPDLYTDYKRTDGQAVRNRETDYKRSDSQSIIDKHVKSMEKVWMRYMKI